MSQQYYYSSLTGPQMDAALLQISQAAEHAANAAASAAAAKASAQAAEAFASDTNGYSEAESDSRFASAITQTVTGAALTVADSAPLPPLGLRIFGETSQSPVPAPGSPVYFHGPGSDAVGVLQGSSGQTLEIPTGGTLHGVRIFHPNTPETFADSSGRWIADEIDLAGGQILRRFQPVAFDGGENWYYSNSMGAFYTGSLDVPALGAMQVDATYTEALHRCSHFPAVSLSTKTDGTTFLFGTDRGPTVAFCYKACADVAAWKAFLAAQAAAGTPVTVLLCRTLPLPSPVDEAVVSAFRSGKLDYGQTVLQNDAGARMQLRYVADTGLYITRKMAELSAAMIKE